MSGFLANTIYFLYLCKRRFDLLIFFYRYINGFYFSKSVFTNNDNRKCH